MRTPTNEKVTEEDLILLRPQENSPFSADEYFEVLGKEASEFSLLDITK